MAKQFIWTKSRDGCHDLRRSRGGRIIVMLVPFKSGRIVALGPNGLRIGHDFTDLAIAKAAIEAFVNEI